MSVCNTPRPTGDNEGEGGVKGLDDDGMVTTGIPDKGTAASAVCEDENKIITLKSIDNVEFKVPIATAERISVVRSALDCDKDTKVVTFMNEFATARNVEFLLKLLETVGLAFRACLTAIPDPRGAP